MNIPIPTKYSEIAPQGYWRGLLTIKTKQTIKALNITRMSHYVTLEYIRLTPFFNGYIAKIRYCKNYRPTEYFTEYYDKNGIQVNRKDLITNK